MVCTNQKKKLVKNVSKAQLSSHKKIVLCDGLKKNHGLTSAKIRVIHLPR